MKTTPTHTPSVSILLVEDASVTIELLSVIIPKNFPGVALYSTIDGNKGLELFKKYMQDIVITDINMPEMSGLQMAEKIHAIKPDTKFIVISGGTDKSDMEATIGDRFEIDHFIVKPVRFEVLFAAIEKCIGEIAHPAPD